MVDRVDPAVQRLLMDQPMDAEEVDFVNGGGK